MNKIIIPLMVVVAFFLTCNLEEQVISPEYSDSENAAQQSLNKVFTYTESWINDLDFVEFMPCGNDGKGEDGHITGKVHLLVHFSDDGNGGWHYKWHANPQKAVQIGLTTGDIYQATGTFNENSQGNIKKGETFKIISSWFFIGKGKAVNFKEFWTYHVTINADGEVTFERERLRITCN
jgi:hypothetical protein